MKNNQTIKNNEVSQSEKYIDNMKDNMKQLLELVGQASLGKDYLNTIVNHIKSWVDCDYVGIRILDKDGKIPYRCSTGFGAHFLEKENRLSIENDSCFCVHAVTGMQPYNQYPIVYTQAGSFYCNNMLQFADKLSAGERMQLRGVCIQEGFLSVAVVPIRYRKKILGVIHIADKREGRVPFQLVEFMELAGIIIGKTIHRFSVEEELEWSYTVQVLINSILRLSLQDISLDKLLQDALNMLVTIRWLAVKAKGCIFLVDETSSNLIMKAQCNLEEYKQELCANVPIGKCLCGKVVLNNQIQYINYIRGKNECGLKNSTHCGHLCIPISSKDKALGVISLYLEEGYDCNEKERESLITVANTLAGVIDRKLKENALKQSYERLKKTFKESVRALTSIAEKRDSYTAGHQSRVEQLACAIAQEMALTNEVIEGIHVAASLHDIGKIYVPAEFLAKPGKISDVEFAVIKTHPQIGYEILSVIEFPWPIAKIAGQHHERINGSGYPYGLLGDEILLESKILAVADVVEAMSSHRPYRPALGIEAALEEILKHRGILYDADVVDVCVKLFGEKGFAFNR